MNNNFNLSPEQTDALLSMASKKMGIDPADLRRQMQSGDMSSVLSGLAPAQRDRIQSLMQNPAAIQQLVQNPKVQQLLRGLMGK